jgi:DTW domain-containing protein YfiP
MRSRTADDLPGRCPHCWVLRRHCVCAALPRVENRTELVILRHETEAKKSTGTARIAELVLSRVRLVPHNVRAEDLAPLLQNCWLLYPTGSGSRPAPTPPERLLVLDGTWVQTRHMLKKMPQLAQLPWLSLPSKSNAPRRLRSAPTHDARSTLEAIADALEILEGNTIADPIHRAHAAFVSHVLTARGKLGPEQGEGALGARNTDM